MADTPWQVGDTVLAGDNYYWYVSEFRHGVPYGYRVTGPTGHVRYGGSGSAHHHHTKHHHAQHHHRRAAAPPHHADNSTPGSTRHSPALPAHASAASAASGPSTRPGTAPTQALGSATEAAGGEAKGGEGFDVGESVEKWEKRHARPIMAVQGIVDMSAGVASVLTTIELVSVLAAPETLGLSLAIGIAVLAVYDITRGTGQVAVGFTEETTALLGSQEQVERVGDGMEKVKTLMNVSAYVSFTNDKLHHRSINWKRAKHWGDVETIGGGILQGRMLGASATKEEVEGILNLGSRAEKFRAVGEASDKSDQVNSAGHTSLDWYVAACKHLSNQEQRRNAGCPVTPSPAPGPR